jgi:TolB protein
VLLCVSLVVAASAASSTGESAAVTARQEIAVFRLSDFGGDSGDIWLMNADGGRPRNLTRSGDAEWEYSWSPDGRMIAFASFRNGSSYPTLWVMRANGTGQHKLHGVQRGSEDPAWSPDGRTIAYTSDGIFLVNAMGSGRRRLTRNHDHSPNWSPDGRTLAFVRRPSVDRAEIFTMARDGSRQHRLTRNNVDDLGPAWSPDGRWIAFWRYGKHGAKDIYLMKPDGSSVRRIMRDGHDPSWSPDASRVAFVRYPAIWIMTASGALQRRISPQAGKSPFSRGQQQNPEWTPR